MTCIVGYKENGKVYIGGDSSSSSSSGNIKIRKQPKVIKKGGIIFGFSGSFKIAQLVEYSFNIPKQKEKISDIEYLCTAFSGGLVQCLIDNKYGLNDENEMMCSAFLIGYNAKLYTVYADFQIAEHIYDYSSLGSGEEYALGALKAMEDMKYSPIQRIEKALESASCFCSTVEGPFNIISL